MKITDEKFGVQIGKVEGTMLGVEDHGILSCMLYMDFGGSGQGAGGYSLDTPMKYHASLKDSGYSDGSKDKEWTRVGTAYGMEFIRRIIMAFGVEKWEDIKGKTILILREDDGWGAKIVGLRPLPTESGTEFIFSDLQRIIDKETIHDTN